VTVAPKVCRSFAEMNIRSKVSFVVIFPPQFAGSRVEKLKILHGNTVKHNGYTETWTQLPLVLSSAEASDSTRSDKVKLDLQRMRGQYDSLLTSYWKVDVHNSATNFRIAALVRSCLLSEEIEGETQVISWSANRGIVGFPLLSLSSD